MSDPEILPPQPSPSQSPTEPGEKHGPNLAVLYGLLALAIAAALAIATLIVLPFYRRR